LRTLEEDGMRFFILIEEVVMDRFIAQSGMRNVIFQTDNNNVIRIVKSPKKTQP
jgi:hypothetical protein